jgi:SNF2 family DNA or RNA helicase
VNNDPLYPVDDVLLLQKVKESYYFRGRDYFERDKVQEVWVDGERILHGEVSGSGAQKYEVTAKLGIPKPPSRWASGGGWWIEDEHDTRIVSDKYSAVSKMRCSCPVQISCKHCIAVVLKYNSLVLESDDELQENFDTLSEQYRQEHPEAGLNQLDKLRSQSLDENGETPVALLVGFPNVETSYARIKSATLAIATPKLSGSGWSPKPTFAWHQAVHKLNVPYAVNKNVFRLLGEIGAIDNEDNSSYISNSIDFLPIRDKYNSDVKGAELWKLIHELSDLGVKFVTRDDDQIEMELVDEIEPYIKLTENPDGSILQEARAKITRGSSDKNTKSTEDVLVSRYEKISPDTIALICLDANTNDNKSFFTQTCKGVKTSITWFVEHAPKDSITIDKRYRGMYVGQTIHEFEEMVAVEFEGDLAPIKILAPTRVSIYVRQSGGKISITHKFIYQIGDKFEEVSPINYLFTGVFRYFDDQGGLDEYINRMPSYLNNAQWFQDLKREAWILAELYKTLIKAFKTYKQPEDSYEVSEEDFWIHSSLSERIIDPAESPYSAIFLVQNVLPALKECRFVDLISDEKLMDLKFLDGEVEVSVGSEGDDNPDWLDLNFTVKVGDVQIEYVELFTALAEEQDFLITSHGEVVSLQSKRLDKLRKVILESRGLIDKPRISKYRPKLLKQLTEAVQNSTLADLWTKRCKKLLDFAEKGGKIALLETPSNVDATLRDYQSVAFSWLTFLYDYGLGGVLADDMGLGKTLETLTFISHILGRDLESEKKSKKKIDEYDDRGQKNPFIVVAPASVISNWQVEAKKFTPHLRTFVKYNSCKVDKADYDDLVKDYDVVIMSYAVFRLDSTLLRQQSWSGLILDEAQMVKNPNSQSAKAVREFLVPFKLAVTGTPMENNLNELWSIFAITAPGLFGSLKDFRMDYIKPIEKALPKVRYKYDWTWDEKRGDYVHKRLDKHKNILAERQRTLEQLKARISPFLLRRTKEEVASDLPDKIEQVMELDLNDRHQKIYQQYLTRERQKMLVMLEDMNGNRFQILQSLTLLRQVSIDPGLVTDDELPNGGSAVLSTKTEALMELLEDIVSEGHKCLIFSQFTTYLRRVADVIKEEGYKFSYLDGSTSKRGDVIDEFKNGENSIFLISLKAGGFGLNLTEADYVIILDPWWNPAAEEQAIDRTHRIGQKHNVNVYRLVSKGTIEDRVMELKAKKGALFDAVMGDAGDFTGVITADVVKDLLEL